MTAPHRAALVAGATGLVGSAILALLVDDPAVDSIHVMARRPAATPVSAKVHWHVVDFTALPALPPVTEVYLALGTTIRQAGSQEAFRAVDFHANLAVAKAALAAGALHCGLVSSQSADSASRLFYSRVKGELEVALQRQPWHGLVIARPSFLAGDRQRLGQPPRPLERMVLTISAWIRPLLPRSIRPIAARAVAQALVHHVPQATGHRVLPSDEMQPK